MDDNERLLIDAARGGDAAAWEVLYRRLHPRLRSYVARRVGSDDADDVLGETMTRAVSAIGRFVPQEAGFDGWVFGIARRVSADHVRRAVRSQRNDSRLDGWAAPASAAPDDALMLDQDHADVRAAFDRLRPDEQDILELRVIAGLSVDAVAQALGKRRGAVRTAQSRALGHLRSIMASAALGEAVAE